MENLEHQASVLFGEKEFRKALEIYQLLMKGNPKVEKYVIACGNCYDALGEKEQAIELYTQALKINKASEAAMLNLSTINYEIGNYEKSTEYAENTLKQNPNNIAAWQNLANIAFCNGNYEEALKYYQKMYEKNNNSYIAMINLANTYYSLGKYVLALEFAKKSLERHPSSVVANMISGNALAALEKYEKAIDKYLRAYELDEHNREVLNALSEAYHALNDWENCIVFAWRYVKTAPEQTDAVKLNFGYLLYECYSEKSEELARKYAAKWLNFFPNDKIVQHMACALTNGHALLNSDHTYIKATFDAFAADFEETLSALDYQAPSLLETEAGKHLKTSVFKGYHILDLGCGTGLCGEKMKKFASRRGLIGVDLSEKMLDVAREKKIYAQLICDDICHYLETTSYFFHVEVASDVLTYFGDLTKVFVRVSKSLTPGGMFFFTVSENSVNEDDFFMVPSGRFVHNSNYVERVLKSAGLRVVSCERHILRNEAESPVYGYVFAAAKPELNK
ncbi:MAG: tetratricopeptide repeat protein [Pseudomonadota bacterium]|nr:tetratricopeptide repeat protein [Pseudomonadota bacterium]